MKTFCITMLLMICFSLAAQNDQSTKVITINLSKPTEKSVTSTEKNKRLDVKTTQFLQIELVGGNPLKYNYTIDKRMINFFEDKTNNPLKNIEKLLNNNPPKDTNNDEEKKQEDKNKTTIEDIKKKITDLEKQKPREIKQGPKNTSQYNEYISKLTIFQKRYDELLKEKEKYEKSYEFKAKNAYKYLDKKPEYKQTKPTNKEEDIELILSAHIALRDEIEILITKISHFMVVSKSVEELNVKDNFIPERNELYEQYSKYLEEYFNIRQDASKFDQLGDKYESVNNELKDKFTSMLENFKEIYSLKTENYLLPIEFNGKNIDVVQIGLKKFEKNIPIPVEECEYNIWLKGGLKIDISGGVYITSLVNREYYTETDKTDATKKIISEKEQGNYDFGFGSSINIAYRTARWINPAINVGAIFTTNQQFQLLTGLGAILGKEERIILSGGVSMGRISQLAQNLKVGQSVDLGDNGTIPTSSVFKFGGYFGITYNFNAPKKQNMTTKN